MSAVEFLSKVADERAAQDRKWGTGRMPHMSDEKLLRILVEEVGECAKAIEDGEGLDDEIVQVGACAALWWECRREQGK